MSELISEFKDEKPRVFFPTDWANAIVRWIQGVHSKSGTIKTHNTINPTDESVSLDVDIPVLVEKSKELLLKSFVGRGDETAIDCESLIVKDGKFAVSEAWLDGRKKKKTDDDGTESKSDDDGEGNGDDEESGSGSGDGESGTSGANFDFPFRIIPSPTGEDSSRLAIYLPACSLVIDKAGQTAAQGLTQITELGNDWYALPSSTVGKWWLRLDMTDSGISASIVGTNNDSEGAAMVLIALKQGDAIRQMLVGTLFVTTDAATSDESADTVEPVIGNMPPPFAVRRTWVYSDALKRKCYEYWIMVFPRSDRVEENSPLVFRFRGVDYKYICRRVYYNQSYYSYPPYDLPWYRQYGGLGDMLTLNPNTTFQYRNAQGVCDTNAGVFFPRYPYQIHWNYLGADVQVGDTDVYAVFVDLANGDHVFFISLRQPSLADVKAMSYVYCYTSYWGTIDLSNATNVDAIKVARIENNDITQVYQYERPEWVVEFRDWDGTVIDRQIVLDGEAATAPNDPSRGSGYTFTGWDSTYGRILADTVITAQYEADKTVVFVDWDGTTLKTEVVAYGQSATAPNDPTRANYTFSGWSQSFDSITADCTITAQYNITDPVTITFIASDVQYMQTRQIPRGTAIGALPTLARENYSFNGWHTAYTGGDSVSAETIYSSDASVYAQWTQTGYVVYFASSGAWYGQPVDTLAYTQANVAIGAAVTFPAVTINVSGWVHAGWIDDRDGTPVQGTVIPSRDKTTYRSVVAQSS